MELQISKTYPNKCLTRAAAVARYGPIDFASRHWPDRNKWIKVLPIPPNFAPWWKVLDTSMAVHGIACNIDLHEPLTKAFKALEMQGLQTQLKTFDGCYNIRMVRGSNTHFSAHSYGLALDFNAKTNPMSTVLHTTFTPQFIKCFTDQGFDWGGNFKTRKDPMHFSYCFEG